MTFLELCLDFGYVVSFLKQSVRLVLKTEDKFPTPCVPPYEIKGWIGEISELIEQVKPCTQYFCRDAAARVGEVGRLEVGKRTAVNRKSPDRSRVAS